MIRMVVGGVCEKFSCLSGVAHELYHELVPPRSSNRKRVTAAAAIS